LKLMPGMTATVTILVAKKEGVLKVPTVALRFQPPADQIEIRKDSVSTADDSARAERRRQFMQRAQEGGPGAGQRPNGMPTMTRLWVLTKDKKLSPIFVRPGMADGTFTEILRGKVEEGQEVVVGTLSQKPNSSATPLGGGGRMRF
jgi:HlyD family secretion protein